MRKKLTIDKWYGGISNDPSVWGIWSYYDARGIDIRKDSKKVTLSNNFANETVINSRANGFAVWAMYESNTINVYATRDGKLSNSFYWETSYWNYYTDSTYTTFYNLFRYYGPADYGVIIAANGILRFAYDSARQDLWALNDSLVTNGDMWSWTGWTYDASWVFSGWAATHTPWSTTTLTQTLTVANTTKYIVRTFVFCSAWSVVISMWGTNLGTITTSESQIAQTYSRTTASTSEAITFTPSSDFAWNIDFAYVQKSNVSLAVAWTFNADAPVLTTPNFIFIWTGNTVAKVDTSTSSFSLTTPVSIDQWYTVKGITKVWDQIYIYASDGSNGKQYIWDGSASAPSREILWYDKPITRVINLNNIDYIVVRTSKRAALYVVNWYQPQLITQSGFILPATVEQIRQRLAFEWSYINGIETIWEKILIPSVWWLFSYGNQNPWFPRALVKEYTWDGLQPTVSFYEERNGYHLYVFYTSAKSGSTKNYFRAIYQNNESPNVDIYSKFDPGYIQMQAFYGSGYNQKKSSIAYKIWAKIPTGTIINVYSRVDDEVWYVNFYTDPDYDSITTMPVAWATYTNGWVTYTVLSVSDNSSSNCAILHCSYSGTTQVNFSGTLTKATWTGDSTIKFYRITEYKLIKALTNSTNLWQRFKHTENYNKIEWMIELFTTDTTKTPELYDFQYLFDEIETDI